MQKITSIEELRESILLLEAKQESEGVLLKEQFKITYESLKPVNLVKTMLTDLTSSPDFKGDVMTTTLSLAAGYLSKKAVVGSTSNPFKQILGSLIQMGVSSIVAKNSDGIKSTIMTLINNFTSKKEAAK